MYYRQIRYKSDLASMPVKVAGKTGVILSLHFRKKPENVVPIIIFSGW